MKETNSELAKRIFDSDIYKNECQVFVERGIGSRGFRFKLGKQDDPADFSLHVR